jgi:hypothetical protein
MLKTSSGGQGGQSALTGFEKKLTGRDPDDSVVPAPVRKSVRFMLGGAAVTIVSALFQIVVLVADRNALGSVNGSPPSSSEVVEAVVIVLIEYAILTWVWVLMARLNRSGQTWARIAASVLFALSTWNLYSAFNSLQGGEVITVADIIYLVLLIAIWIAGLGAVALLWRPESTLYFKARAAARR